MTMIIEGREYDRFSERHPKFLEKFPIGEFSLITSPIPLKEVAPQLAAFSQEMAEAGNKQPPYVAFKAELRDKNDRLLASATALTEIVTMKDWEKGETAAMQRLIGFCGFGSGMFDLDEIKSLKDRGVPFEITAATEQLEAKAEPSRVQQRMPVQTGREAVVDEVPTGVTAVLEVQRRAPQQKLTPVQHQLTPEPNNDQAIQCKATAASGQQAMADASGEFRPAGAIAGTAPTGGVRKERDASMIEAPHPQVLRQIQNLCKSKRVQYAAPATKQEAQQMLLNLQRRTHLAVSAAAA